MQQTTNLSDQIQEEQIDVGGHESFRHQQGLNKKIFQNEADESNEKDMMDLQDEEEISNIQKIQTENFISKDKVPVDTITAKPKNQKCDGFRPAASEIKKSPKVKNFVSPQVGKKNPQKQKKNSPNYKQFEAQQENSYKKHEESDDPQQPNDLEKQIESIPELQFEPLDFTPKRNTPVSRDDEKEDLDSEGKKKRRTNEENILTQKKATAEDTSNLYATLNTYKINQLKNDKEVSKLKLLKILSARIYEIKVNLQKKPQVGKELSLDEKMFLKKFEAIRSPNQITMNHYYDFTKTSKGKGSIFNIAILFFSPNQAIKNKLSYLFKWENIEKKATQTNRFTGFYKPYIKLMIYQYEQNGTVFLGHSIPQIIRALQFIRKIVASIIRQLKESIRKNLPKDQVSSTIQKFVYKEYDWIKKDESDELLEPIVIQLVQQILENQEQLDDFEETVVHDIENHSKNIQEKMKQLQDEAKKPEKTQENCDISQYLTDNQHLDKTKIQQKQKRASCCKVFQTKSSSLLFKLCALIWTEKKKGAQSQQLNEHIKGIYQQKKKKSKQLLPQSNTNLTTLVNQQVPQKKKNFNLRPPQVREKKSQHKKDNSRRHNTGENLDQGSQNIIAQNLFWESVSKDQLELPVFSIDSKQQPQQFQDPMDQDPMDQDPMDQDPMDQDPMDQDPMDQDPMDQKEDSFCGLFGSQHKVQMIDQIDEL